jgi:GNAT superfamily N-acetyltransferase
MSLPPGAVLRQATRGDVAAMQRIRHAVRENRLVSTVITDQDVRHYIEDRGRGWVVDTHGAVTAFSVADLVTGSIWALFVDPGFERQGYGRALLEAAVQWLRERAVGTIWLTTEAGTRAESFYRAAGWQEAGLTASGERRFELRASKSG